MMGGREMSMGLIVKTNFLSMEIGTGAKRWEGDFLRDRPCSMHNRLSERAK